MQLFGMVAFAAAGQMLMLLSLPTGSTADMITEADLAIINALSDGPLVQPPVLTSSEGRLDITVSLAAGNHQTKAAPVFYSRLFNGSLPGQTLRVNAGDAVYLQYQNELSAEEGVNECIEIKNQFCKSDITNLHFHGWHISGKAPSDDVHIEVLPGDSYPYEIHVPEYHHGGIAWMHPHVHGSTTEQILGGASSALIINDAPDSVPVEVANAEEVLLMVQNVNVKDLAEVQATSRSTLVNIELAEGIEESFRMVNGQYRPTLEIQTGEWYRFRVIFANWDKKALDFALETEDVCEMYLLAKDGLYIPDYPRTMTHFPIPTAGRADIMVRCLVPGTWVATHYSGSNQEPLLTLTSVGELTNEEFENLTPVTRNFPFPRASYTMDLLETPPTEGCSCTTWFDDDKINDQSFQKGTYVHTISQGSIIERLLEGVDSHPYHQHVYPFQLTDLNTEEISATDAAYFQVGDYHDTVMILTSPEVSMRYIATAYDGNIAVQCHRTDHADMGMISSEFVADGATGGKCECSARTDDPGFTAAPTSTAPVTPTAVPVDPEPTPIEPTPSVPISPIAPTCFPHATEHPHPDECVDDPTWFLQNPRHGCAWVGRKPSKRCKNGKSGKSAKGDDENAPAAACPQACGTCDDHHDDDEDEAADARKRKM
mmetsp:Transcript_17384/g.19913  ORF Transcript_17384/g.19913 Transcript_17384/m.19913 type:complete len:656 (+) Transcript_17384:154-2121(+)